MTSAAIKLLLPIPNAMSHKLLIYGASGHAKVIIDIVEQQGVYQIVGLLDDTPERQGQEFFGYCVLGGQEILDKHRHCAILVAIGDNHARKRVQEHVKALGYELVVAIHPSACLARDVSIGPGTVIMAQVAINSGTVIGEGVIVNTGATIDHDCRIGDFAHISPGGHLAGNVTVGALTQVGIGVSVIPGVRIGENTVIGAGAAVVTDIPDGIVAVGVPAKVIKNHQS
jgi:sugar O-acyltransferase (sialic acid O-acetyltransferase NeuD family)